MLHNGHEFVDLGLSVNWAVSNIGAKYPEEAGRYFSKEEVHAPELAGKDLAEIICHSVPLLSKSYSAHSMHQRWSSPAE